MTARVSVRVESRLIEAAPGDVVPARVVLSASGESTVIATVRSIGLDGPGAGRAAVAPVVRVEVVPGTDVICEVPITVPAEIGAGQHAVGIEVESPGERPQLVEVTVAVASVRRVEMEVIPAPVRGRRRAKFHVDVVNNEPVPVEFELTGESRDVSVRFAQSTFRLAAGERATTKAKTRGPRLWRGEPLQHTLLLTARSAASSSTTTAPFVQRAVFVRGARVALAAVVVIVMWIAAIAGVLWWLGQRGDDDQQFAFGGDVVGVDTDGDGVSDQFFDANGDEVSTPEGVDQDGDGVSDTFVDDDGNTVTAITAVDTDGDGVADVFVDETGQVVADPSTGANGQGTPVPIDSSIAPGDLPPSQTGGGGGGGAGGGTGGGAGSGGDPAAVAPLPQTTTVRGTVSAEGSTDLSGLSVTLTPVAGGAAAPTGTEAGVAKYWPIRTTASFESGEGLVRQSETVTPTVVSPDAAGVWEFARVQLRTTYEITFAGQGYDTTSVLVAPPDNGEPVSIDVALEPAIGALRGRVTGPGGVLGGASIRVSDGLTSFTTTADTEGDPGSFRIEGLSTPGVYTVTTSLDGYATDVRQLDLAPGEQVNGIDIGLARGVATITGRITDASGQPLAGANVSATNGADQRVTTSFTAGDLGAYSLPQLTIGTTYTITVTLDGFGTQTRRVPVGGSISGINVVLSPTSSRLTGTVTSSGGGVVIGAGVTLQNGDLEFRTSTAEEPAGSFEVDDLPAGSYTVTIEQFEHESSTQFVDIVEGVDPAPLAVTLALLDGVPSVGSSELVVEVVDPTAANAEDRQISDATVVLTRTRTGEVERQVTQEEFDFRITEIPVGTYTLAVTAPGYAASAPRQVSIGLQTERREVALEQLGAARGRVIDALTKAPTEGVYALQLSLVVGTTSVPFGSAIVGDPTTGAWETESSFLPPGEYIVSPTASPPGYEIRSDQILDPAANGIMRFVVTNDLDEPVQVGDIEADPYPDVRGRVLTPRLDGSVTQLEPINSNSLAAVLRCDGVAGETAATVLDNAPGGTGAAPRYDEYFVDFREVDANDTIGNCRVDVTADTFLPASVDIPALAVSNGFVDPDRVGNVALRSSVDSFGGQIFWRDPRGGTPLPIDAADISTRAITSIDSFDESGGLPGSDPNPVFGDLSSTSVGGAWALEGHVFGPATYAISAPGFTPTSIDATIDESRNRTVTESADVTLTPPSPATNPVDSSTSYDIELTSPLPGEVQGQVTILTTSTTPDFAGVDITAVDPGGAPVTTAIQRPATDDGSFTIPSAAAGTWDVDFGLADNHILHTPAVATARVTDRVDPSETQAGFDTTLVDLATVQVTLINDDTNQPITTPADLALTAVSGNAVGQTPISGSDPNGVFRFDDVVVDVANPTTTPATYNLAVAATGFDSGSATILATTTDGQAIASGTTLDAISIEVRAGGDVAIEIRLEGQGTIVGTVEGVVNGAGTPLEVSPDGTPGVGLASVIVSLPGTTTPAPGVTVRAGAVVGQFEVTGPPGDYLITVTHPAYRTLISAPAGVALTSPTQYRLQNDVMTTLGSPFRLQVTPVTLRIDALEDVGGTAVDPFTYEIFDGPTLVTTGVITGGSGSVPGLTPGPYRVVVRAFDPTPPGTTQTHFPFVSDVTLRLSNIPGTDTTTIVSAIMPRVSPGIQIPVTAENEADDTIALPAASVIRSYSSPTGLESDDQGGPTSVVGGTDVTETFTIAPGPSPGTIQFDDLVALGTHDITFPDVNGFTAPDPITVVVTDVSGFTVVPTAVVYEALDVTTRVTVTAAPPGADFVDLTARLIPIGVPATPLAGILGVPVGTPTAGQQEFEFTGVSPGVDYQLGLLDPLFQPTLPTTLPTVFVPVNDTGDINTPVPTTPASVPLTATNGRLNVSVETDNDAALDPSTIELVADVGGAVTPPVPLAPVGEFQFDVAPGGYELRVSNGTTTSAVTVPVTIAAGVVIDETVTLRRISEVTVTVTPAPPPGATVVMENSGGTRFNPDGTPVTGQTVFTFFVPRNQNYRVEVGGTYPTLFEPAGGTFDRVNGSIDSFNVTLPRVVQVNVTNATATTQVVIQSEDGATDFATDTVAPFRFDFPAGGAPPGTGTLRAVIIDEDGAGPNFQTEVRVFSEPLVTNLSVTMRPLITVTGQLTTSDEVVIPNGTLIEAVETDVSGTPLVGGLTIPGAVGNANTYSIPGVLTQPGGILDGRRYYTIQIRFDGAGLGQRQFTVDNNSGATAVVDVTVEPELRDIEITVVDAAGDPVENSPVTISDVPDVVVIGGPTGFTQTVLTDAAGVADFSMIRETLDLNVRAVDPADASIVADTTISPGPADVMLLVQLPPP